MVKPKSGTTAKGANTGTDASRKSLAASAGGGKTERSAVAAHAHISEGAKGERKGGPKGAFDIPSKKLTRLSIHVPADIAKAMKFAAASKGMTLTVYLVSLVEADK